jgi:hypothetical protein
MQEMKIVRRNALTLVLSLILVCAGIVVAQKPERDISSRRHPNLAAAQRLCTQAYERIAAAQRANEWDMNGHAQRAKELLDQVNSELKKAAEEANERH